MSEIELDISNSDLSYVEKSLNKLNFKKFNLAIKNDEQVLVNYEINIKRLNKDEKVDDIIDNPKTGGISILVVISMLIISLVAMFIVRRRKVN